MTWVSAGTLDAPTSGTFVFTGLSLSGVKRLRIECLDVTVTTDGTDPWFRVYISGSEIQGSTYHSFVRAVTSSASSVSDSAQNAAQMLLCSNNANFDNGNASTESWEATIDIHDPGSSAFNKHPSWNCTCSNPNGRPITSLGVGLINNTGAIDGIKVGGTSNLTGGRVRLLTLT